MDEQLKLYNLYVYMESGKRRIYLTAGKPVEFSDGKLVIETYYPLGNGDYAVGEATIAAQRWVSWELVPQWAEIA